MMALVTEIVRDSAIEDCVDYAHCPTCVANSLTEPDNLAIFVFLSHIQFLSFILFNTVFLIHICHGKHKEQRMNGTRDDRQKVRVGNAVDIVKGK
jgi:hypothetical protein